MSQNKIFKAMCALGQCSIRIDMGGNWYIYAEYDCYKNGIMSCPYTCRNPDLTLLVQKNWENWLKLQDQGAKIKVNNEYYVWDEFMWTKTFI